MANAWKKEKSSQFLSSRNLILLFPLTLLLIFLFYFSRSSNPNPNFTKELTFKTPFPFRSIQPFDCYKSPQGYPVIANVVEGVRYPFLYSLADFGSLPDKPHKNIVRMLKRKPFRKPDISVTIQEVLEKLRQKGGGEDGKYVVDVGANVGMASFAAAVMGFKVLAFEPVFENLQRICDGVFLNRVGDRVTLFEAAASDRLGNITFHKGVKDPSRTPFTSLSLSHSQFDTDLAVAMFLQECERVLNAGEAIDFGSSDDAETETEQEDDDELSYEELLALVGELVGTKSRGISTEVIASLPSINYKAQSNQKDGISTDVQCSICRLEYEDDDALTFLSCNHSYHLHCINHCLQINKLVGRLDNSAVSATGAKLAFKSNEEIELQVRSIPLDEVIAESEEVILLKIDVQGWEYHVLRGASKLLSRKRGKAPYLIYEEDERLLQASNSSAKEIREFLGSMGYHQCTQHGTDAHCTK